MKSHNSDSILSPNRTSYFIIVWFSLLTLAAGPLAGVLPTPVAQAAGQPGREPASAAGPAASPTGLAAHLLIPLSPPSVQAVITWSGAAGDGLWSNPANWAGGRLPGAADIARFVATAGDARIDRDFGGVMAGLLVEAGYTGRLRLERDLNVAGTLRLGGGRLEQGRYALHTIELAQPGGEIVGGSAPFIVDEAASVGGLLTTPGALMSVRSLDIQAGAVVRLGANGKLNLTGEGTPLTGAGRLDILTHRPNSVEFTGKAVTDIALAGPAAQLRALNLDKMDLQAGLQQAAVPAPPQTPWFKPMATFAQSGSLILNGGESFLLSAVIDPANNLAYFGTDTSPGQVVKVNINPASFARVGVITLNTGENQLRSAVIDPANNLAYFGTDTSPGQVIKIDISPAGFTRMGAITLISGEDQLRSAVIDPDNDLAYFGTFTSPGQVVKVDISPAGFTRVGAITLTSGEDQLRSAVIDLDNDLAYFGTLTNPGRVVKIDISPAGFTRVGAITLTSGENELTSAVIDTANDLAYFGTNTNPGRVVKVDTSPAGFGRIGAITLTSGEGFLLAVVIDPANSLAYFGTFTSPGRVIKVDISPAAFARLEAITLNGGEDQLFSAVIDTANGLAYFGTFTGPGRVIKIDVSQQLPEIAILGNGLEIADGDASPSTTDETDFDSLTLGQFLTRTFTISNAGEINLDLTGAPLVSITGPAAGDFSIDLDPATPIGPAGTTSFQVRFEPLVAGTRVATLTIANNDNNEDPYDFAIQGVGSNQSPIAAAGPDQSVSSNATVTLDGTGSSDPDGHTPLTFGWNQIGGPTVTLSDPINSQPTFTAPDDPAVLTFTLTVTDSLGLADTTPDEVVITVNNQAPTANAGSDQSVDTNALVALDGAGSSDPDNDLPLTFGWSQTGGPAVILSSVTISQPTFTAPGDPAVLTFTLTVTDSLGLAGSTPDEVVVTVGNQAPIADAGLNQSVGASAIVTLDGASSSDPDNDLPLTFGWSQTGGPAVVLSSATISQPTFTAPATPAVLTFTLTVTDNHGLAGSTPDEVVVTVSDSPITGLAATNSSPTILGNATTFTATISGGSNAGFSWDFGDGNTGSGATPNHTYGAAGTYSAVVTASNSVNLLTATTVVTITSGGGRNTLYYLPILVKTVTPGPDLVIDQLTASSGGVTVEIRNAGNDPVATPFWVDVYFNPNQTPQVNKTWQAIAPAGAAWGVTETLDPGETLTLVYGGLYFFPGESSPLPLPAGAQVYALVDSVNYATTYGAVQESNESNNLSGPVVSTTADGGPQTAAAGAAPSRRGLPKR